MVPINVKSIQIGVFAHVQAKEHAEKGLGGEPFQYVIDKEDVKERMGELLKRKDLSRFVL